MKWATKAFIHLDRVASAWLILRFIDIDATFTFLGVGQSADLDVTVFGVPGSKLVALNTHTTTFQTIVEAYAIVDPAIQHLGAIINDTVNHVLHDKGEDDLCRRDTRTNGFLAMAEGVLLLSHSDEECLQRSLLLYDAYHARLQAQVAFEESGRTPVSILDRTTQLAGAAAALRASHTPFSAGHFGVALRALSKPSG